MFAPGREALLQDSTVTDALRQVATDGWTEEARANAESALLAMYNKQPELDHKHDYHDQKHIMASYQWNVQEVVKRVVSELQVRGYRTWFGAFLPMLRARSIPDQTVMRIGPCVGLFFRPGQHERFNGKCFLYIT